MKKRDLITMFLCVPGAGLFCTGNVHVPAAGVGRCSTGSMDRGGRDSRAAVGVGVASYYVRQAGRAAFQWRSLIRA